MIKKNNNKPRNGTRSKCELRKKKTNINFCFWSVQFFNHTNGHSLRIGANRDKS